VRLPFQFPGSDVVIDLCWTYKRRGGSGSGPCAASAKVMPGRATSPNLSGSGENTRACVKKCDTSRKRIPASPVNENHGLLGLRPRLRESRPARATRARACGRLARRCKHCSPGAHGLPPVFSVPCDAAVLKAPSSPGPNDRGRVPARFAQTMFSVMMYRATAPRVVVRMAWLSCVDTRSGPPDSSGPCRGHRSRS